MASAAASSATQEAFGAPMDCYRPSMLGRGGREASTSAVDSPQVAWWASAIGLVLLAATTVDLATGTVARDLDHAIIPSPSLATAAAPLAWQALAIPGSTWFGAIAVLAGAILHLAMRRDPRALLRAGAWILALEASTLVIELLIGRTSPHSGNDLLAAGGISYPSSYAADSFTLLLIAITLATSARTRPGQVLCWCAPLIAALVAIASVRLHDSWPSDAISGWLLGLTVAPLAHLSIRATEPRPA